MGLYGDYGSTFYDASVRRLMDLSFWAFAIIYLIGDYFSEPSPFTFFTALTLIKPIPIFIIAAQIWPVRSAHPSVFKILVGLVLGSAGDILLLVNGFAKDAENEGSITIYFILGVIAFLAGHVIYVISFLQAATDSCSNSFNLAATMSYKLLFMAIWTIIVALSFFALSGIVVKLEAGSIVVYVLPIYGTFLLMMVMASFFFYFTCRHVDPLINEASILAMVGALSFFISDILLAELNFNTDFADSEKILSLFNMITYYLGQFLIGKAGIKIAAFFQRSKVSIV